MPWLITPGEAVSAPWWFTTAFGFVRSLMFRFSWSAIPDTTLVSAPRRPAWPFADYSGGRKTFELHSLRLTEKIGPDNEVKRSLILQFLQHREEAAGGNPLRFAGGTTLVVRERSLEVTNSISKSLGSKARLERARAAFAAAPSLRQIHFEGTPFTGTGERFAILHKSGDAVCHGDHNEEREENRGKEEGSCEESGSSKEASDCDS